MSALVRSELRRATGRRLVRIVAGLGLLAAVAIGAVAFARSSSADAGRIRAEQAAADRIERRADDAYVTCLADRARGTLGPDERCEEPTRPTVHDPRFGSHRMADLLRGTSAILALVAWVVGATLIGAEHQSRGLTTTLTFLPQRTRVFTAKALTAVGVAGVGAVALLALVGLGLLPAVLLHGDPIPGSPGFADLAGIVLRGGGLAAVAGALGFALASLGRSTAAALGVGFAYVMVIENVLGSSLEGLRSWLLLGNTIVWVSGKAQLDVPGRSVVGAGLVLGGVAVALLAVGAASFRVRDVA